MNNLTEEQKRLLTEWMGEVYHDYFIGGEGRYNSLSKCSCGLTGFAVREICAKANRTFDAWQDLGDLKERLVKNGLWDKTYWFLRIKYTETYCSEQDFTEWILNPIIFCKLVAAFKPWERGE